MLRTPKPRLHHPTLVPRLDRIENAPSNMRAKLSAPFSVEAIGL